MPILSLRIIKKPRVNRRCAECFKHIEGETIRLYGMAEYGDKPSTIFVHRKCLYSKDALAKLEAAEQGEESSPLSRLKDGGKKPDFIIFDDIHNS